jgi:chromosome segregation ATPase
MDKAHQESLAIKFGVDLDPKTNVEYRKGSKKSFYLEIQELKDDYEGSQQECASHLREIDKLRTYNTNQMNQLDSLKETHTSDLKALEEVKVGQKHTIDALEEELVKVRSQCDSLKANNNETTSLLALADEEIQGLKEVAAEWEHRSKSVRKIPLLGTETLSYQSDILLRWQDHMEHWNELVSDFQDKYCPALSALTKTVLEFIDSFVRRVKNVEIS